MTTLAILKARIADELSRSDLTTQVAYAISDAIAHYQKTRFYFNETGPTGLTFNTVASQETYTTAANALLPYVYDVDDVFVTVGGNNYRVRRIDPSLYILNQAEQEGQPYNYMFLNQTFSFTPIPNTVYVMQVVGHYKLAEPAADGTTGNKWMTDAERLIRSAAKRMLYQDVILDDAGFAASAQAEQEALDTLRGVSNSMMKTGYLTPTAF